MPLPDSFNLAIGFDSATSLLSGWLLMLAAMMPPLVAGPLGHVQERSFARRRLRAMSLFVIGYLAVWTFT